MPQQKACKECGKKIPADAKFCPFCGSSVDSESTAVCKKCGASNPAGARYCQSCGSALSQRVRPSGTPQQSQTPKTALWKNPYLIILTVALLAMVVATVYNFRYIRIEQQKMQTGGMVSGTTAQQNMPASTSPAPQMSAEEVENHIQELKERLKNEPNNVQLYIHLGNLYFDTKRFQEAIPYYEKAVQLDPTNPDVVVDLGVSYFELENYTKAKELFQTALQINPNHTHALYNLGVVSLQLKDFQTLMNAWGKLIQIAPNSPQAQQASHILDQIHQSANMNQKGG